MCVEEVVVGEDIVILFRFVVGLVGMSVSDVGEVKLVCYMRVLDIVGFCESYEIVF